MFSSQVKSVLKKIKAPTYRYPEWGFAQPSLPSSILQETSLYEEEELNVKQKKAFRKYKNRLKIEK